MKTWSKGTVLWFDDSSGEGMVWGEKEECSYYVHFSAIQSTDVWKTLAKGSKVEFKLYTNLYMSQVDKVRLA